MPTERFFNLPEEKKQRIIAAATAELSRVPFDQISINKIIQAADIPRGSFYQYFEDKLDLLDFILKDCKQEIEQAVLDTLQKTDGDLFSVFSAILNTVTSLGFRTENTALFQNIFPHLKPGDSKHLFPYMQIQTLVTEPPGCCNTKAFQVCFHYLKQLLQSGISEQDLMDTLEILVALLRYTIAQTFFHPVKQAEIQSNFTNKLAILKRGLLGEEINHVKV